jgi:hypothetical protein
MKPLNKTLKRAIGFEVFGTIYLLLSSRVVIIKKQAKKQGNLSTLKPGSCPAINGYVGNLFIMDLQRAHQFRTAES